MRDNSFVIDNLVDVMKSLGANHKQIQSAMVEVENKLNIDSEQCDDCKTERLKSFSVVSFCPKCGHVYPY